MYNFLYFCLAIVLASSTNSAVVWISLGGFRSDYLDNLTTPNLVKLFEQDGVISLNHKSMFATTSLPNHFSQATGLTQEHHGMINDYMYDSELGLFEPSNTSSEWWNPNETTTPLWTFNEQKMGSSAVIGWPGAGVKFGQVTPNFTLPNFSDDCDVECKLNIAYEQIELDRHNLVMLYIDELDKIGQRYGPSSNNRVNATSLIDASIGNFFERLDTLGISNETDFIISSDHGMAETPILNRINIQSKLEDLEVTVISTGPVLQLNCNNTTAAILKEELAKISGVSAVYLAEEIPDDYHYKNSPYVATLTVVANDTYSLIVSDNAPVIYFINCITIYKFYLGGYGYPIQESPDMKAFFAIRGPSILNVVLEETTQTDLYIIACTLLGYGGDCNQNDGSLPNGLLKQQKIAQVNLILIIVLPIAITLVIIAIVVAVYYTQRKKTSKKSSKA